MNKVALFGGTFDPIHLGHFAVLNHLVDQMDFDEVIMVPTSLNPLKQEVEPATTENRLKMIEIALADFQSDKVRVDTTEISQVGPSYSIDTLKRYSEEYKPEQLYLVMGIDTFSDFDHWKSFDEIIGLANILVVSRPPYRRPLGIEELPKRLQEHVHSYERGFALLKTDRTIEFVNIKTEDIASKTIRKKLKSGKGVSSLLNLDVEKYIIENEVYPLLKRGEIDFREMSFFVGNILKERAMNSSGYDLSEMDKLYDYTLIASATSTKQAQALAMNIKEAVNEEYGLKPFGIEGKEDGRWVILDYGALLVHIFYDYVRHEYHLEQLWKDGKRLDI